MSAFIGVILVDDHAVVREGYRRVLERCVDLRVVGEAGSLSGLQALLERQPAQVIVMDIALPGSSGIEATRRITARHPDLRVLISSMYEDAIFPARALEAGALGYVTKASPPEVLIEAIRRVALGQRFLSQDAAQALALRESSREGSATLSARELEVLRQLLAGRRLEDIAQQLSLSVKTVANHQSSLRQKLGAESLAQLFRAAVQLGLLPGD